MWWSGLPWRKTEQFPSKHWYIPTRLHGVTSSHCYRHQIPKSDKNSTACLWIYVFQWMQIVFFGFSVYSRKIATVCNARCRHYKILAHYLLYKGLFIIVRISLPFTLSVFLFPCSLVIKSVHLAATGCFVL